MPRLRRLSWVSVLERRWECNGSGASEASSGIGEGIMMNLRAQKDGRIFEGIEMVMPNV
jgi:hypothetical protein